MTKNDNNGKAYLTATNIIRFLLAAVFVLAAFGFDSIMSQISSVEDKVDVVAGKVDSLKDVMNQRLNDDNIVHNNMMNDIDDNEKDIVEIKEQIK